MRSTYVLLFPILILSLLGCSVPDSTPVGSYTLEVEGMKNSKQGQMEIVGEAGDYFGKLTFISERPRVFEIGLVYNSPDSLSFLMPGKGGYLNLKRTDSIWDGDFKYFGLQATIKGTRTGMPSDQMQELVSLKPIGSNVISTDAEERFPSFDAQANTLYFSRSGVLLFSKLKENQWSEPDTLTFSGEYNDNAPSLDFQFKTMTFTSNRPISPDAPKKKNLWQSSKDNGEWSNPIPYPHPVNVDSLGDYHSSQAKEAIYFISYNRQGGFGRSDIYVGQPNEADAYEVENLGAVINTELSEADVFIDPDERFLLFASTGRDDGYGADDIYISFKQNDQWQTPINLGPEVNSYAYEYGAWVDYKNAFLYFNSYRRGTSDIYRVPLYQISAFREILD